MWNGLTEQTPLFRTEINVTTVSVRSGPGTRFQKLDSIDTGTGHRIYTVHEVQDGWYRIVLDGQDVWLAGWRTSTQI